jgi:protein TonB
MNTAHAVRPDAGERRGEYNRHLGLALGISVGLHLVVIGLYVGTTRMLEIARPPAVIRDTTGTRVIMVQPEPRSSVSRGEPSRERPSRYKPGGTPPASAMMRGGIPVAKDDSLVVDGSFAAGKDIAYASPWGSDITGKGNDSVGLGRQLPVVDDHDHGERSAPSRPKPDDFIPVEEQPAWDADDLLRRVKYPELARRNGVEGLVVVRALIERNGRVVDTQVDRSDNPILTEAAVEAVRATPFTAAKQNGYPVAVWIQIPVTFALE